MGIRCLFSLTVFTLVAADDAGEAKKALDAVRGSWKVAAAARDGSEIPEDKRNQMVVTFDGSEMTLTHPDGEDKAKVQFSPAEKQVSFTTNEGTALGIYAIGGDTLTLCWAYPGNERPKEFNAKSTGTNFLSLKRDKK